MYDSVNKAYIASLRDASSLLILGAGKLKTVHSKSGRLFVPVGIIDKPDILYAGIKISICTDAVEHMHEKFSCELALFEYFASLGYKVPHLMAFFDLGDVCGIWQEDFSQGGKYRIGDSCDYISDGHAKEIFGIEGRFDYELCKCGASINEKEYTGENTFIGRALIDFDKMFDQLKEPYRTRLLQERARDFMSEDYVVRASE